MDETAESWRVSEVLDGPRLKQWVVDWEQANAPHLTLSQRQVLTRLATCVQDLQGERALGGDRPLEELSRDAQRWAEFINDHKDVKKRYNRVMARAVRHGLFACPQYCRRYYRDRHGKVRVRFGVLNEAHPLVLEWVRVRRAVGDRRALHHHLWRTHRALYDSVKQPLFSRHGEADLVEAVCQLLRQRCGWRTIFRLMERRNLLLRNKKERVTQNTWQALHKWAKANYLPELLEMQREVAERRELIQQLDLTPQPRSGYIACVQLASGDEIETQGRDGIGALLQLSQSLWNRFPGEIPQQVSDT